MRILLLMLMALSLSGCLYGNEQMLEAFSGAKSCPLVEQTSYELFNVTTDEQGQETEHSLGRAQFGPSTEEGDCVLRAAANLTPDGSDLIKQMLQRRSKLVGKGVYVSYVPGDPDGEGYAELSLVTRYTDNVVEIRGRCQSSVKDKPLIIRGVISKNAETGETCYVDTEAQLNALAAGVNQIALDYVLKPIPL